MKKFIFDVDGTLTPSRQQINFEFMCFMIKFCCTYDVYLVTGSDRAKTIEQVGLDIYNRSIRVYNCSGADVYVKDYNAYKSNWKPTRKLINFLSDERFIKFGQKAQKFSENFHWDKVVKNYIKLIN